MSNGRIVLGGDDITDLVKENIWNDVNQKIHQGNLNQKDIAKFNHDNPHAMIDGLGEVMLSVEPEIYHAMRFEMKQQMKDESYECWSDPDFCKYVHKNHPEFRGVNRKKIVSAKGLVA
jgi:hypothetical protein